MPGKRYTEEFKKEALKLADSIGPTKACSELGVDPETLRAWSKGPTTPSSKAEASTISSLQAELRQAKEENRRLRLVNDVLKKSTAIFAKDQMEDGS